MITRRQLYLDVSMHPGGGGHQPDGTPTPYIDINVAIEMLTSTRSTTGLVLDPHHGTNSRWGIECALRDAFGWDGKKEPSERHLNRLRTIAAEMDYLPPWRVHRLVVLDKHDECHMPHPGGDD